MSFGKSFDGGIGFGILPNGVLINGVANFYTSTLPTTRVDGSVLVIGDTWKKPGQELAEWDGTQWVGGLKQFEITSTTVSVSSASSKNFNPIGNKIIITEYEIIARVETLTPNPATDFWTFTLSRTAGGSTIGFSPAVTVNNQGITYAALNNLFLSVPVNQIVDFSGAIDNTTNSRGIAVGFTRGGVAPVLGGCSFSISYRLIYA